MFIKLTLINNTTRLININSINCIDNISQYTIIYCREKIEHYVQETPEEILKLIKGTYLNV